MTHYATLGVQESATLVQIRAAYRAAARAEHPDVSKKSGATARFAAVAAAYAVIGDEDKRREYDRELALQRARAAQRSAGPTAPASGNGHYSWTNIAAAGAQAAREESDFDELYETFFAARARGADEDLTPPTVKEPKRAAPKRAKTARRK